MAQVYYCTASKCLKQKLSIKLSTYANKLQQNNKKEIIQQIFYAIGHI